jgi:hypothetical protein
LSGWAFWSRRHPSAQKQRLSRKRTQIGANNQALKLLCRVAARVFPAAALSREAICENLRLFAAKCSFEDQGADIAAHGPEPVAQRGG